MPPTTSGQSLNNDEYKNLMTVMNKKWDECTDAERVIKLREECKQLQYNTNRISMLEERVRALEVHSHADGKVVTPIDSNRSALGGGMVGASRQNNLS